MPWKIPNVKFCVTYSQGWSSVFNSAPLPWPLLSTHLLPSFPYFLAMVKRGQQWEIESLRLGPDLRVWVMAFPFGGCVTLDRFPDLSVLFSQGSPSVLSWSWISTGAKEKTLELVWPDRHKVPLWVQLKRQSQCVGFHTPLGASKDLEGSQDPLAQGTSFFL